MTSILNPSSPIASAHQFITGDPQEYRSAVAELGKDSTIQRIAIEAADYGIAPNATIGSVVKSGIGAGILSKVLNVAAAAGSDSGTSLIGVEAGSVALTLGAIAYDYDKLTGSRSLGSVGFNLHKEFDTFAIESKVHSDF